MKPATISSVVFLACALVSCQTAGTAASGAATTAGQAAQGLGRTAMTAFLFFLNLKTNH